MATRQINIALQVQSEQATFYIQPSCQEGITLVRSCQASCQITVARYGGHDSTVYLSTGNLPAGINATYSPQQVGPGVLTSTLTLSANSTVQHGTYQIQINGFDGQITRTVTLPLYVINRLEIIGQMHSISCTGTNYTVSGTLDVIEHAPTPCKESILFSITPNTPGVTIMGYTINPNPAPAGTTEIAYQITARPCEVSGSVHTFELRATDGTDTASAFIDVFFM